MTFVTKIAGLSFFLLISTISYGQKEVSHWFFGFYCDLDFTSGEPVPRNNGKLWSTEGSAAISDSITGKLLFYTDGRNFWNADHEIMQNRHTLPSNCFARTTQPAIIIPSSMPGLYDVFCIRPFPEAGPPSELFDCQNFVDREKVPEGESGFSLFYYQIDMTLDGGRGNVVEDKSNIALQTNLAQKLTAIPHANGKDYWIITHEWLSDVFYAHHWTPMGMASTVTTAIGSVHGSYGGIYFEDEQKGEIEASPNGKKIAAAVFSESRPFDLFDFDASRGKLSNYINLGSIAGQYGVSFSPDNSKLYVNSDSRTTDRRFLDIILQYDLSLDDSVSIASSAMSIIVHNPYTNLPPSGIYPGWNTSKKGMALAPDGRLYITGNEPNDDVEVSNILVVVDKPNERGFKCGVNYREFNFMGRTGVGLPNFMQSYFNGLESASNCEATTAISLYPNPTDGFLNIEVLQGCDSDLKIEVLNSVGQHLESFKSDQVRQVLDLNSLSSGVYFLVITTSRQTKFVRRVVKV